MPKLSKFLTYARTRLAGCGASQENLGLGSEKKKNVSGFPDHTEAKARVGRVHGGLWVKEQLCQPLRDGSLKEKPTEIWSQKEKFLLIIGWVRKKKTVHTSPVKSLKSQEGLGALIDHLQRPLSHTRSQRFISKEISMIFSLGFP